MILQTPMVDYLRATTFDEDDGMNLVAIFDRLAGTAERRDGKVMQYSGRRGVGMFVGVGEQRRGGRSARHWMFQAAGEIADAAWSQISWPVRVTRIDLQVTVAEPPEYDATELYESLQAGSGAWAGRRKKTILIRNNENLNTCYIGSRSSEVFCRVYSKRRGHGRGLRFELEFKGDKARAVARQLVGGRAIGAVLRSYLDSLPESSRAILADVAAVCESDGNGRARPERVDGVSNTLAWLQEQVEPALMRSMHDHGDGHVARRMVEEWYNEVLRIENRRDLRKE